MKILVTGATGFIGSQLVERLILEGHEVNALSRSPEKAKRKLGLPVQAWAWNPTEERVPPAALEGVEAVVHLAGESVAKRWTSRVKDRILRSRTEGTRNLVESLHGSSVQTICASAIGYYGEKGDQIQIESSPKGEGFLADVCEVWEAEAQKAPTRTVRLRIGLVLGREGALARLLPLFRLGLGGRVSSGRQWMSWIHIDDVVGLMVHALKTPALDGALNAVAPNPVTNREFTRTLADTLGRPAPFPAPGFALKLALGEMAELVLKSQRVEPSQAMQHAYVFQYPRLEEALKAICPEPARRNEEQFTVHQYLPQPVEEVFPFFSDARNLEKITPDWLHFKVMGDVNENIYQGQKIDYRLRIHQVPVRWQSLIEQWRPGEMFVDTQTRGPYKLWHHTHYFVPLKNGTLITDRVRYEVPGGSLGSLLLGPWIRSDLKKIFNYRREAIDRRFPSPH